MIRLAFIGASGTGKTTLAAHVAESRGLPLNPVGSRSVAKDMGFESPYDVDKAGLRAQFQTRLLTEKVAWEGMQTSFVTDRTTLDNLAYTMLHDVASIDSGTLRLVCIGLRAYTHVVYCPVDSFCDVAGDPSRVADATYHRLYDALVFGLIEKFLIDPHRLGTIVVSGLDERRRWIDAFLDT